MVKPAIMTGLLRLIKWFTLLSAILLAARTDIACAETTTVSGHDFYFGIPSTVLQPPEIRLIIDSTFGATNYTVETSTEVIANRGMYSGVEQIILNDNLQVSTSEYSDRNKGIRVRTTGEYPISVVVVTRISTLVPLAYDNFKIHQNVEINNKASYEYFALSTDYNGQSFVNRKSEVLLIANHKDTIVSITPTQTASLPQDAQDPSSDLVSVAPGSTHNVTLNQFQTLLVFNSTLDITGTRIVSNKPLTVLTGHQCAQFPTASPFCEPVHVQVPPSFLWGQKFLLAPFAGRSSDQHYKLVTAREDTAIVYKCGTAAAMRRLLESAGQGEYLDFPSGSYCSLAATKPIFVVQLGAGYSTDISGDPVMAVVSPTNRHINSTTFLTGPSDQFSSSFISITVLAEHFNNNQSILLNGSVVQCSWTEIYNTSGIAGYVCSLSIGGVDTETHTVSHSEEDGLLSVVAYGWNNSPAWGYAYLTGMSLALVEFQEIDLQNITTTRLSYFNLSSIEGVKELPRELEASSPPIYLPGFFVFGNLVVTSVYVNENGVLSFNKPLKFSHPSQFPPNNTNARQSGIVAPFWSDSDIRKNGTVRYKDFVKGSSTEGDMLLGLVAEHVSNTESGGPYNPTWMIVAQWDKVHPYPHGTDSHDGISEEYLSKTNTYQAIIVTDRVDTYLLFTYTCGEVQWSGQGTEFAVVGYNSHGDYFRNHAGSGYKNIANIVSCSFQIANQRRRKAAEMTNNLGYSAKANGPTAMNLKKCKIFIDNDFAIGHNIARILENLPICPPSGDQVKKDKLFEPSRTRSSGSTCYRSKVYYKSSGGLQPSKFVQQCCYNGGGLIVSGVDAGSLLDISADSYDDDMYNHCCAIENTDCDRYRKRRPTNNGVGYTPPPLGWGWGDPHYVPFDDKSNPFNTFNAPGDNYYNVVKITKSGTVVFTLQALINGLLIKSMAIGVQGMESYQYVHENKIQLFNTSGSSSIDLTSNISSTGSVYKGNRFEIRRINSASIEVIDLKLHIVVETKWIGFWNFIEFIVQLPPSICGNSVYEISGHLGNCDGVLNEMDQAAHPKGLINAMEEGLFMMESSLGKRQTRTNCTSAELCVNPPKFEDLNFTDAQRQFCNDIKSCLYDLAVTGSEDFAAASRDFDSNKTVTTEILNNHPPRFTANSTFNVTVRIENIYTFKVEDVDSNFTVSIEGGVPNGGQLVDNGAGFYTFRWMVSTIPTNELIFRAVDTIGSAAVLTPVVYVCNCFNGGECTADGVVSGASLTIKMDCVCTEAFDGESCSEDRNGCSEIECFKGVECLDVPAPGVGAVCGPCPTGYTGDGLKCFDINECSDSSLCDQVCENTIGSYTCDCYTGFMLVGDQCQDIDECSGINNCQQECNNTVGSYVCSCQLGFSLNSDNMTCAPLQVCTGTNSCSHTCAIVGGMEMCFCPVGLELQNTTTCTDINECDRFSPCDQVCINSVGSFMCSCESGYELEEDMKTCTDVDECQNAALSGTELCFNNTQCLNIPGSYNCTCVPGYKLVNDMCKRHVEALPVVQITPPPKDGAGNSHNFVIETYTKTELTSEKIQDFRIATAKAITRFCELRECSLISFSQERKFIGLTVESQNIAIPVTLITVNSDGKPVLMFYVQLNSTTFVTAATVSMAVESADDLYSDAGFFPQNLCNKHTPCQNEAICTNTGHGYTCACVAGYTGKNCSVDIDDCASSPCQNGGTCMDGTNRFECTCPPNVMGDQCEVQPTDDLPIIIGIAIGATAAVILILVIVLIIFFCIQKIRHKREANDDFGNPAHKVYVNPIYRAVHRVFH